jgi:hypothetical protein
VDLSTAELNEDSLGLRAFIGGQEARLQDIRRQHAEAKAAALTGLRLQLSEQSARTADLRRQHAEAEAELGVLRQQRSDHKACGASLALHRAKAGSELVKRYQLGSRVALLAGC